MEKRNKVFVINKSLHDFSAAERFGDLIFLSEGMINKFKTNNLFRLFYHELKQSQPTDYILCTGLTTMNIIACVIFAKLHDRLNILIYEENSKTYKERILDLSKIK